LLWLPVRDLLEAIVWCTAWIGQRVTWAGVSYKLLPDGRLTPDMKSAVRRLPRGMVRALDRFLRARQGIIEYSNDAECLLRMKLQNAEIRLQLGDGVILQPGDRYIELHFWNEHFAEIPHTRRADFAWAKAAHERAVKSLKLLADALQSRADLADVKAIFGRITVNARNRRQIAGIIEGFGFEFASNNRRRRALSWLHDRGEDLLLWALVRAYSPFGRGILPRVLPRHEVWISARKLLERYGSERASDRIGRPPRRLGFGRVRDQRSPRQRRRENVASHNPSNVHPGG
jgi:hypothetical protein